MADKSNITVTDLIGELDVSSIVAKEFTVVILAAGLSNRMGNTNKLLLDVNGQSLLNRCVSSAKEAGVSEIIVVLGHDSENTVLELNGMSVEHVINPQYATGQISSVQCGLNSVCGSSRATFICLSDQPHLSATHLQKLMWAFDNRPQGKEIVVPVYQGNRGNPVLLSESVRKRVSQQGGNPGCRRYIDKNPSLVYWVSFDDPAYVTDIDTPDEYAALLDAKTTVDAVKNKQDAQP